MTGKTPIHLSGKTIGITLLSIAGSLILGGGMCFVMVWNNVGGYKKIRNKHA